MATYTTNYNLEKPAQTDIYNVDVFNDNADKIDAGLTDKAQKTMLAPVETTNSASRSYAKGEYFVYNNVLCCATTAIAAGGTIAIGTNCSTAPVGGELKSLRDALPYNLAGTATALNSYIQIPQTAQVLVARVLLPDSALAWTTVILPSMLISSARTYAVGGSGSTTNALWGADLQATSSAICLTRVTAAGAAASNFQLALYYR